MKVSLNTVKQYTEVNVTVDELVTKINQQLGQVEEVIDLGARYEGTTIVRIVSCVDHPNSDHLHVCKVNDGGVVTDVARDENGYVEVVCGAPNVREGLMVVWLPPRTTVPATYMDDVPFILGTRELRGVVSNGMLASAKELGIGDNHDGILEINTDEWSPHQADIKPGASFAQIFGLDDTIIDIENKMFTHRPDLFGQLGVAREISAILGGVTDASEGFVDTRFQNPDWYWLMPEFQPAHGLDLRTFNEAPDKVPRVMFVAMDNIDIKPSPLWLQCALVAMGSKPINNVVDVTNYVMLLTAQPVHAYDYDTLRGQTIGARMARDGETVALLNGKTYELTNGDIVISDTEGPIGLAGIMGGKDSEVGSDTKRIVLEVATFDMYTIRKSSMRHGLFTDAVTRFNKGQSPLQNSRIMRLLMMSLQDVSAATQASNVVDLPERPTLEEVSLSGEISVNKKFINERLGSDLTINQIGNLLRRVNFASYPVESDPETILVTAPFWRTDIEQPEDIVEEVGRLYGFDKLPLELPTRTLKPAARNELLEKKQQIRETLSRAGANEVLSYSFVHADTMKRAEQDPEHAYKLSNALSPELQYFRTGITASLLEKVAPNYRAGYGSFALFELGKVHYKGEMDPSEPNIPNEDNHVALVITYGDTHPEGTAYYQVRYYLEQLVRLDSISLVPIADFDLTSDEWGKQLTAPYEPKRSAVIVTNGQIWGVVGEFRQSVHRAFKLPDYIAGFEVHLDILPSQSFTYVPLSKYPSTERDICFQVNSNVAYGQIVDAVRQALNATDLETNVVPVDIYQPPNGTTKNVTLRIKVTSSERTLTGDEVAKVIEATTQFVIERVGAQVV